MADNRQGNLGAQRNGPTAQMQNPAPKSADNESAGEGAESKVEAPKKTYVIADVGSIWFKGENRAPGTEVELTDEEAADLGDRVRLGRARPKDIIEKRKAGRYKVSKDHNVWTGGANRETGFELELSAEEAVKLGPHVEPVEEK